MSSTSLVSIPGFPLLDPIPLETMWTEGTKKQKYFDGNKKKANNISALTLGSWQGLTSGQIDFNWSVEIN